MPVIWTYRRLAFDVLAGLSLPLSLTDAAVDPLPKQVRVAAVAGVLLNHVDQYRAQRRATAVLLKALNAEVGGIGDELLGEGHLAAPGAPGIVHDRRVGNRAEPVSIRHVVRSVQRGSAGLR